MSDYTTKKGPTKDMAGIRAADSPPMISFHSPESGLFEALPYHDIRRICYGAETNHRIEIEFWRYLVVLEGTKLAPLSREIAHHRIAEITETKAQDNITGVQAFTIAKLEEEDDDNEQIS